MGQSITDISVFGEYKYAEDRVTAALLKIFQVGGTQLIRAVFSGILDLPSPEPTIISQYSVENSRPDGKISCNCNYEIIIESKIVPNAIRKEQLEAHYNYSSSVSSFLVYITPDTSRPKDLPQGVLWISWNEVRSRLEFASSQTSDSILLFLIREFKIMLEHILVTTKNRAQLKGKLLEPNLEKVLQEEALKRVIIVGGHIGEEIARKYKFYACQPNRFFLKAKYIAFYHQNRIKYLFEIAGEPIDEVDIRLIDDVDVKKYLTKVAPSDKPEMRKYMKLKFVKEFDPVIENDKKAHSGKSCAFLQRQAYTTYDKIIKARCTSDL